jgi:O-antigen ligase
MPDYLKALIVVVVLAAVVFRIAAPYLSGWTTDRSDFRRRVGVWFGVTIALFAANDFWLFILIAAPLLAFGGIKDRNPLAFYCALLCAAPTFGSEVSGLGLINYFFELNYLRLLSLVVLFPAAWRLFMNRSERLRGPKLPDVLLLAYLVLLFILTALGAPFTTALRQAFYLFIDVWLLYYVASRSVRDIATFRDVVAAFVLGATVMAVLAIFEAVRVWLLYSTLDQHLGVTWGMGNYLGRGAGGPLRAMASTGHPIVMGYLMVVAIPLLMFLKPAIRSRFIFWLCLSVLVVALVATLSRGPWIGGVAMALVVAGLGRGAFKRFGLLGLGVGVVSGLALMTDFGRSLFSFLPFVGTVGSESIEYRQRLFEVSLGILWQSPFFGVPGFYANAAAQELRGVEGIIDVVNSYIGVAVSSGVVGLSLFVGLFACAGILAWRTRSAAKADPQAADMANSLLATIAAILVTIATASSIGIIAHSYFMVAGIAIGCCGEYLARTARVHSPAPTSQAGPGPAPLGRPARAGGG